MAHSWPMIHGCNIEPHNHIRTRTPPKTSIHANSNPPDGARSWSTQHRHTFTQFCQHLRLWNQGDNIGPSLEYTMRLLSPPFFPLIDMHPGEPHRRSFNLLTATQLLLILGIQLPPRFSKEIQMTLQFCSSHDSISHHTVVHSRNLLCVVDHLGHRALKLPISTNPSASVNQFKTVTHQSIHPQHLARHPV